MTPRWKTVTYGTLTGLGLLVGSVGIAAAATSGSASRAASSLANTAQGAIESDDPQFTSSVTIVDNEIEDGIDDDDAAEDAAEDAALAQLATITADQASQSANAAVPGTVCEVELDEEDGSVVYSVEILTDTGVVEVVVDAGNGNVLAQEVEDDDYDC